MQVRVSVEVAGTPVTVESHVRLAHPQTPTALFTNGVLGAPTSLIDDEGVHLLIQRRDGSAMLAGPGEGPDADYPDTRQDTMAASVRSKSLHARPNLEMLFVAVDVAPASLLTDRLDGALTTFRALTPRPNGNRHLWLSASLEAPSACGRVCHNSACSATAGRAGRRTTASGTRWLPRPGHSASTQCAPDRVIPLSRRPPGRRSVQQVESAVDHQVQWHVSFGGEVAHLAQDRGSALAVR